MIKLYISDKDPRQFQLKERLEDLSLAKSVDINTSMKDPVLIDGKKQFQGVEQISDYIDEMQDFMKQWYACRCDMFEE